VSRSSWACSTDAAATACAYDAVELVVWSGTGNSLRVAERVAAVARGRGAAAEVRSAAMTVPSRPPHAAGRRLLGLLGPTHGFTAPWPLLRAAATVPAVRGVDAFVLVTRGAMRVGRRTLPGFEGTAAYLPALLLALQGARVRGVGAVDMPQNWTVVIPAGAPAGVAAIVARGDERADAFAARLLRGERAFGGWAQLAVGAAMLPLSLAYLLIARLVLAKAFFADERCTSCGACAAGCPHGAIRLLGPAGRPYWTFACHNCMRCMSRCPEDAIQGAQGWLLFYAWAAGLPVAVAVVAALGLPAGWASGVAGLLVGYGWIVVVVWVAYALLWLGLGVPGLRLLLGRATLTRWYRRYRGPGRSS
jgi:ferredoxin